MTIASEREVTVVDDEATGAFHVESVDLDSMSSKLAVREGERLQRSRVTGQGLQVEGDR